MSAYLTSVICLSVMRMAISMLLPDGDARRYADLGVGLAVTLQLLRALYALLRGAA